MKYEEHCRQAFLTFGDSFSEVHLWLDEFSGKKGYGGLAHRRERHHWAAIQHVQKTWGPKAAAAAKQHVISDLGQIGWKAGDPFPKNKEHYDIIMNMLLKERTGNDTH